MVYIYALCDVYYDSFYIEGIRSAFPDFAFNVDKFPKFAQGTFAAIFTQNGSEKKIIIDSRDTSDYDLQALDWCDTYGKINYNLQNIPRDFEFKIKPIGPSFGIRIWSKPEAIALMLLNYFKFNQSIANKREFFANFWRQTKRLPISAYRYEPSQPRYVFFTGSIWKKETNTNRARAAFIKACRENRSMDFEGGFAPRKDGNNLEYNELVVRRRFDLREYISKTKQSAMVFNTPAVLSCHGWKLGEYLALGKAIITTKHANEMPAELQPGVHMVYVDSEASIAEEIDLVLDNLGFRSALEKNAAAYFEKYLAPKSVIARLLSESNL